VCVSALDNLGKGGSANGVQSLNILFGWDERTGLDAPPVYP
jgi:N-acetyl-gamma-glutamylphosphate reductase